MGCDLFGVVGVLLSAIRLIVLLYRGMKRRRKGISVSLRLRVSCKGSFREKDAKTPERKR